MKDDEVVSESDDEWPDTCPRGVCSGIDTTRTPTEVVHRFLQALRIRWPQMYVVVNDDENNKRWVLSPDQGDIDLPLRGVVFIYRDSDMQAWGEEHGGIPMPDGEGYLSLWFWPPEPSGIYPLELWTPAPPDVNEFSKWVTNEITKAAQQ